jgi:hypothetical protein
MSIYPEILKRVIANKINTTFSDNPQKSVGIFESSIELSPEIQEWNTLLTATQNLPTYDEPVVYILLWLYLQKNKNTFFTQTSGVLVTAKFSILPEIHKSRFITHNIRQKILSIFQQTQRTYYAFSRLSRVYRHKRTPVQIDTDLYMNDLTRLQKNTFVLFDNGKLYYFSLNDLAKIFLDSLTYSYLFFPEPKVCKNPYNNIPFTKSTLYNIYFQMKSTFCVVPRLIQLFFEADFNVYLFKKRNESLILEYIIREYVAKTEPIRMRADILKMVNEYDGQRILTIHPLFPSKSLLNGLKQMYILYLTRTHTQDGKIYENYGAELIYRMNCFVNKNPQFGRMNFQSKPHLLSFNGRPSSFEHRTLTFSTSLRPPVSPSATLSGVLAVSGNTFVFGQPNVPSLTDTNITENVESNLPPPYFHFTQSQPSRFVFHHRNTTGSPGYSEAAPYIRSPDIVQEFLENHQYNETSYNRYVYSGSIYSVEQPQPLPELVSDNYNPDPDPETESDEEEYVLRVQQPRHDNETVEETHATYLSDVSVLPLLSMRRATPNIPGNIMAVYYYDGDDADTNVNENDADNEDNNSTSTEEQQNAQMNRQYEHIIAGDDSSELLSVASSIDTNDDYDDNDGYDSVS